jgi:hypothetical protein
MHRLFRLAAVFTAIFMIMAGLKVQPAAAAQDGLTGDTSYESPKFGYSVEWTSDWEVIADFTTSGESTDSLRIYNAEYGSWIDIWGFEAQGREPGPFLESYIGLLTDSDSYANLETTEQDSADPDAVAVMATYELGDNATPIEDYIEVRPVGDALVLTSIKAAPGFSLIVAILAMAQVELDGDPLFPSLGAAEDDSSASDDEEDDSSSSNQDDEDTSSSDNQDDDSSSSDDDSSSSDDEGDDNQSSSASSGVDGDTYTGPTYGVFFEFDSDAWDVVDDLAADDNNGRDMLLLEHADDPPIRVYFETYDTVTRASDCLESASEEAYGDADAEIFEDEDGEPIEDSSRGVAYAAYLFESEGDELVAYVECRALPEGAGVFVITMFTLPDDYEDSFAALSDILDTVELEGGSSSSSSSNDDEEDTSSSDDEDQASSDDEEDTSSSDDENQSSSDDEDTSSSDDEEDTSSSDDDEDSGSSAAGAYESPTYGFVVEYDEDVWTQTDDSSRRGTDVVELENEDDVLLTITATEAGSRDDAQSCVEDFIDGFDAELIQVTDSETDDPFTGETEFGYYSIMAYDDEDGETHALFIECGASPDEDFLVLFVADGPWDGANDMVSAVAEVIEGVQF